jgi:hypothetical protein
VPQRLNASSCGATSFGGRARSNGVVPTSIQMNGETCSRLDAYDQFVKRRDR